MKILKPILILVFLSLSGAVHAQKQLVVLKREDVLLRLYPGDELIYKLKGNKSVRTSYVNNLSDTAVVAHRDTIPFHRIERLYFPQRRFYNTIGSFLVIFGGGLFLIDQINVVLVQKQPTSLDDGVTSLSLYSLAAGLPLMLLKKKSQKLGYRYRIMTVERGSVFYRPDTRTFITN